MPESKVQALAMQLFFVSVQARKFGNDAPPPQWSPLRVLSTWEGLSEAQRTAWVTYAQKFCGLKEGEK